MNNETKSVFATIIGKPNVGKSSLLNALLGEKIAIVTNKPQTTRTRITGVLTVDETQYVFIDTPGFHTAKTKLSENMINAVTGSIKDVDVAIMVVDATRKLNTSERTLIDTIKARSMPSILVINKIDLVPNKEDIAKKIIELSALHNFDAVIPISVTKNSGVKLVIKELEKFAENSVHYFPDDTLTDQPERVIVAEIVREKLLINLYEEIPHGVAVIIEKMALRTNQQMYDIDAMIYCEKESHKGMIIGKNGEVLKRVATTARTDIENFLDLSVNLKCWVKVREDWRNSKSYINNFGLSN